MSAEDINQQLQIIYTDYLNKVYAKEWEKEVSAPLLMHVYDDYLSMNKKIMFVGQETHGWSKMIDKRSVENLQNMYEGFGLGKYADYGNGKKPRHLRSPFWNFNRAVFYNANSNNPDVSRKTNGFLWTNISKFDFDTTTPSQELQNDNPEGFILLKEEIRICKPDVVVFLTGKKYDSKIKEVFDADFLDVSECVPIKQVIFKETKVPYIAFKTEHPRALCQGKNYKGTGMYRNVVEKLSELINQ